MIVPALFVADSVHRAAGSTRRFDTIIFAGPSEITAAHRQWASDNGITLCDQLDASPVADICPLHQRLSPATLMKLLLPGYLSHRYEKILYLDSDLTIHDDVSSIFALDTGDLPLAAVPSGRIWSDQNDEKRLEAEEHFRALGMTPPYRFFNSGVLLINVEKWNAEDLGDRTLSFIRQNPDLCYLPDEHGLNAVLDGRFVELSPIWNARPPRSGMPNTQSISQPVIIHHAGKDKPWRRYGYRKRLFPDRTAYRLYESFIAKTPWPDWLDRQWTGRDLYKTLVWEVRRATRRLRGKRDEPSRQQRRAFLDEVRRYVAQTDFADVAQGIAIRENGSIRLKRQRTPAA